jgi:vitamin B12 transporter
MTARCAGNKRAYALSDSAVGRMRKFPMKRPGAPGIALWFLALPALVQAAASNETIVVFSERAPLLRSDGSQAIAIITRAQIEARNPASTPDLLREVAGVHVDRIGAPGGATNIYIRGAEPNHTVVLVDGVRVNDPTDVRGGSFDLSSLLVEEVERIEILRGASSAQFGADAMGGVVNIVTRRPRTGASRVSAIAGAGGQRYLEAAASVSSSPFRISAQALEDGDEKLGGTLASRSADASLLKQWNDSARSEVSVRHGIRESKSFPESSGGVRLAADRTLESREATETIVRASHSQGFGTGWHATVTASGFDRDERRDSPEVPPGPGGLVPATVSRSDLRRTSINAQVSRSGLPWESIAVAGAESMREAGSRDSILRLEVDVPARFAITRETTAAFIQVESSPLQRLRTVVGARVDRIDPGDSESSGSAGVRYEVAPGHALRAHWSEGFKPPSFFALGDPIVGNPSLAPERSRSREVGWEARGTGHKFEVTAFDSRVEGLVDFDAEIFRLVNRSAARIRGAELAASIELSGGRLDASYTYSDAQLIGSTAPLRNRPRHRGSLAYARTWGPWIARAAVVHVGKTFDFSVPTGDVVLAAYTAVDLSLRWTSGALSIAAAVDNAFDRDYESFVGFAAPGARARIRASYTF